MHKVLEVVKANDDYQGPDDTNSMTSSSTNTTCRTTTEEPTPSRTPASLTTWLQAPSTSSPGPGSRPPRSSPWRSLPSTPWPAHSSPITDSAPASTQPSVKRATPPTDPRSPVKVPQPTKRSWDTSNKDYDVDISGAVAVQDQARFDIAVERKHDSRRRDPHELTRGSRRKDTRGSFQSPLPQRSPSPPSRSRSSKDPSPPWRGSSSKGPSHRQMAERNGYGKISPHQMLHGELPDIAMRGAALTDAPCGEKQPQDAASTSEPTRSISPGAESIKICLEPRHAEYLRANVSNMAKQLSNHTKAQWTLRGKVLYLRGPTCDLNSTVEWLETACHRQDQCPAESTLQLSQPKPKSALPWQISGTLPPIVHHKSTASAQGTDEPAWRQEEQGSSIMPTMPAWVQDAAQQQMLKDAQKAAEIFDTARSRNARTCSQEEPLRNQSGSRSPRPEQTPSIACAPATTMSEEPARDGMIPMWRPMAWMESICCHLCGIRAVCTQGPPHDVRDAQGRWACVDCLNLGTPAPVSERSPLEHRSDEASQGLQSLSDTLRSSDVSERQALELRRICEGLRRRRDSSCAWYDNLPPEARLNLMKRVETLCLQGNSAKGMMMKLRQEYTIDSPQALHVLNHALNDSVASPHPAADASLRCINDHPLAQPFRDLEAEQQWKDFQLCQGCQDRYLDGSIQGTLETTPHRPTEIIELSSTESLPTPSTIAPIPTPPMTAPTPTPSMFTRPPATPAVSFGFAQEPLEVSVPTPVSDQSQGRQASSPAPSAGPPKQTAAPGAPSGGGGGDDSDDDKKGPPDRDGTPPAKRGRRSTGSTALKSPPPCNEEPCLRTRGICEDCSEHEFFRCAANHLAGSRLWRQTLDRDDAKKFLTCIQRNKKLVEPFSGEEQTGAPGDFGGNWARGQDFLTICQYVLRVAHTEDIALPDHSRLWNILGVEQGSPAALYYQKYLPNYLQMSLDAIIHHGNVKFGDSHSCLNMNQRKKELLLTASSFHDLLWSPSDADSKTISMQEMFNHIRLILTCNHTVEVSASEAIQVFCRVLPVALKEELKTKLNPSEVGDIYKLSLARFEQAIRLVRAVSKAEMRHMVRQQAPAKKALLASAPAETLERRLAAAPADRDHDWPAEFVAPPTFSAPAESIPATYEYTMLDTAPRPPSTSATRGLARSMTPHTTSICHTKTAPSLQTGPRYLQLAAYDLKGERNGAAKGKDDKPPRKTELPTFIQEELKHPLKCLHCQALGMVQTRVDRDGNCPFDPAKPMNPHKAHWRVWFCIWISGLEGTQALLDLDWTPAALEASMKANPDGAKKYERLLQNETVRNTRTHNKAERADSVSFGKNQPAVGTQRSSQLGEDQ